MRRIYPYRRTWRQQWYPPGHYANIQKFLMYFIVTLKKSWQLTIDLHYFHDTSVEILVKILQLCLVNWPKITFATTFIKGGSSISCQFFYRSFIRDNKLRAGFLGQVWATLLVFLWGTQLQRSCRWNSGDVQMMQRNMKKLRCLRRPFVKSVSVEEVSDVWCVRTKGPCRQVLRC